MKWVTREHPKTDRIACPWLIRKFIDPEAEILYCWRPPRALLAADAAAASRIRMWSSRRSSTRRSFVSGRRSAPIAFAAAVTPLRNDGDRIDGWEVVAAPGHADGQLTLFRDGVLVAADHLLDRITPTVGLWPESRPDPLGDFLAALGLVFVKDSGPAARDVHLRGRRGARERD